MNTNEVIQYVDGELKLDVTVSPDKENVWLNREQIATLFDKDIKTIKMITEVPPRLPPKYHRGYHRFNR